MVLPKQNMRFGDRLLANFSLLVFDVLVLTGLYLWALIFRYGDYWQLFYSTPALSVMVGCTLFHLYIIGGYNRSSNMRSLRFLSEYIITLAINFAVALLGIYFLTDTDAARAVVTTTLVVFPMVSIIYRRSLYGAWRRVQQGRSLCVLGCGKPAQDFYHMLKERNWHHSLHFFDPANACTGKHLIEGDATSPVVQGNFLAALEANQAGIETLVVAVNSAEMPKPLLNELISRHFIDIDIQTVSAFCAKHWRIISLGAVSTFWAFDDSFALNQTPVFDRSKRIGDFLVCSAAAILLLPLFLLLALAIKIESRGPALFKQTRVGRNQKPFTLLKFRSMRVGSEKGSRYTQPGDARITRLGRWMRKTRLDELPQLWNVIRGEMSLIGPRAEWDELVNQYEKNIPYYHFRHIVKPGITGWAQVNYSYGANELDTLEKLKYDLYYVRHYSFFLDLNISLKTLYIMCFGKGQ